MSPACRRRRCRTARLEGSAVPQRRGALSATDRPRVPSERWREVQACGGADNEPSPSANSATESNVSSCGTVIDGTLRPSSCSLATSSMTL